MFRSALAKQSCLLAGKASASSSSSVALLSAFAPVARFSAAAAAADSTVSDAAAAAAAAASFPLSSTARHRQRRVQPPTARGEAWGQVLVSNKDLVVPTAVWTPKSVRTGVVGRKVGMLSLWDGHGRNIACTAIQIEDCQVLFYPSLSCEYISRASNSRVTIVYTLIYKSSTYLLL